MKKPKLAETLRKLIETRGITTRELSLRTKVPQSSISAICAGRSSHKHENLLVLANFFGVSLEYLIFGEDQRPSLEKVLEGALTESVYSGWLRVKIERVVPDKKD